MASGPPAYQFFFLLFGTRARGDALLNDRALLVETCLRGVRLLFRKKGTSSPLYFQPQDGHAKAARISSSCLRAPILSISREHETQVEVLADYKVYPVSSNSLGCRS
jgi:hypothetical protein